MNSALKFNVSPYAPFMQETKVTLGNGIELCQTAYPWRDGANILFEFLAPRDAIDAAVQRVDARLRALLDDLTIPSGG